MLKPFMKTFTKDQDLMRVQSNIASAIEQIIRSLILDSNTIEIDVSASALAFNHGLGRVPEGWLVIDKDANVNIWATGTKTSRTITFQASGNAAIKVLIF